MSPTDDRRKSDRRQETLAQRIWLTTKMVVQYLNLPSPKALYQFVRRGHLKRYRLGRRLFFSRVEIDETIKASGR